MSIRSIPQRTQFAILTALLFLAALVAVRAPAMEVAQAPGTRTERALELEAPGTPAEPGTPSEAAPPIDLQPFGNAAVVPVVVPNHAARQVFLRGVVESVERDVFGRAEKLAIVSVTDQGILVQNPVEDVTSDGDLDDHVGEEVTARGRILVKTDGTAALLVEHFEVNGAGPAESSN